VCRNIPQASGQIAKAVVMCQAVSQDSKPRTCRQHADLNPATICDAPPSGALTPTCSRATACSFCTASRRCLVWVSCSWVVECSLDSEAHFCWRSSWADLSSPCVTTSSLCFCVICK
jgi:hypothetical protein